MENTQYQEVLQRILKARSYVTPWRENIRKWRSLYNMKNRTQRSDEYVDPTHTNAVDLAVGIMLANKMRFHAYGFAPSRKEQFDTGKIEKALQATWDANDLREERSNSYELFLNFVRDGGAAIYGVFDPALAEAAIQEIPIIDPESEEGYEVIPSFMESPIRAQIIDPAKLLLLPGGPRRWLLMGREEEMSVLDVMIAYPEANFEKYSSYSDFEKSEIKGTFMDIWDYVTENGKLAIRNTVLFDDILLMGPRLMPGYTELPYTVQFYKPVGSQPESWMNVMSAQETSVEMLERATNRRSKQIDIFTALPLVSKTQTGRVVQVDGSLFNHVNLGPDESIEFPKWQGNAPDVQLQIDFLRSRVNQSGFSEVMFGMGSGDAAGYAMSQMSDQNRIRLEQPIYHLELLLTTWAQKTLKQLLTFASGFALCAYGQYKGKDFNEHVLIDDMTGYTVVAEIRPSFPAEETRNVAMATQSKGLLSDYTIMQRFFGIEQPEDEQERKLIEIVSAHPMVIQYTIMQELTERAEGGDEVAAQVLEQMKNEQAAAAQGRPEDPNNPTQFSGLPSPTGELTSQEQGGMPRGQSSADKLKRQVGTAPQMNGGS